MYNVQMQGIPETLTTFFSSGTKNLSSFFTFSFSTRGERDTIFTMLTVPTSPTVNSSTELPGPISITDPTNALRIP